MSKAQPSVIVIAGANGAGKSTIAPYLLRDQFGVFDYVNADTIALGLSAFQSETVAFEAGRIMLKRLQDLAGQQQTFAFESTLASRFYARWLGNLKTQGYRFHLFFLWLRSVEMNIERVRARVRAGGHDVPEEVIRRPYKKGIQNFFQLYQPLADGWSVYENSAAILPLQIAEGERSESLKIHQADLWANFCEVAA